MARRGARRRRHGRRGRRRQLACLQIQLSRPASLAMTNCPKGSVWIMCIFGPVCSLGAKLPKIQGNSFAKLFCYFAGT
jgi:hypothetical protein